MLSQPLRSDLQRFGFVAVELVTDASPGFVIKDGGAYAFGVGFVARVTIFHTYIVYHFETTL